MSPRSKSLGIRKDEDKSKSIVLGGAKRPRSEVAANRALISSLTLLVPGGLRAPTRILSKGLMVGDVLLEGKKKSRVRSDGGSLIRL